MDHLAHPKDRIPINNVPVFESALHLYDGLGFKSFLGRTERSSQDLPSQRIHAWFIQGWLYFGLLREIFGDSLQVINCFVLHRPRFAYVKLKVLGYCFLRVKSLISNIQPVSLGLGPEIKGPFLIKNPSYQGILNLRGSIISCILRIYRKISALA